MRLTARDLNPLHVAGRLRRKLLRLAMRPLFREHAERLAGLRDRHRGERCVIIGNGPSLAHMDLTPLEHDITFGANALFLHYDTMGFRPTYYTVADGVGAEDRADEINALTGSVKLIPQDLVYCIRPGPDVIYFPYDRSHDRFPSFARDASRVVYWGSSVTYIQMQLAYHMGIRTVYLIGCDFEYTIPDGVKELDIVSQGPDPNHFHPDYHGKGYRWVRPRFDRMETAFRLAREAFEADGRRIINATPGGKLEVFPRQSYDELIRSPKEEQRE